MAEGAPVTGVPYTWGGFDSTAFADGPGSTSDGAPWTGWDGAQGAVNYYYPGNGPLVGNATTEGNYVPGTAGIDCSGFVYAAAGYISNPKKGTSSLMTGESLAGLDAGWTGNVQAMNYFVKAGHTFYYEYRQWSDTSGVNTLEATIDGAVQRAKRWFRTWGDLAGYQHKSWWPFVAGDTYASAHTSQAFNAACEGVRGQSVWYRFFSSASAVTLTSISGGDPDLWVFHDDGGGLAPSRQVGQSTNAGSSSESVALPGPGSYYAMVHIHASAGGCTSWAIGW